MGIQWVLINHGRNGGFLRKAGAGVVPLWTKLLPAMLASSIGTPGPATHVGDLEGDLDFWVSPGPTLTIKVI